jgi:hypothetical protein
MRIAARKTSYPLPKPTHTSQNILDATMLHAAPLELCTSGSSQTPTSGMNSLPPFLRISAELRLIIYRLYFQEGGYHYNHQTKRLVTASGGRIDLSLTFVSRSIAKETHGVPLEVNAITFTSGCHPDQHEAAHRFDWLAHDMLGFHEHMMPFAREAIAPEVFAHVKRAHPEYTHVLDRINSELYTPVPDDDSSDFAHFPPLPTPLSGHWRDVPSVVRSAMTAVWRAAAAHDWQRTAQAVYDSGFLSPDQELPLTPLNVDFQPWMIPTLFQLEEWEWDMYIDPSFKRRKAKVEYGRRRPRFRFSAAASAIEFLAGLPRDDRRHVRKIDLCEDQKGVVFPECHAAGLIPYCRENPALRVEHRVCLFSTVLRSPGFGRRPLLTSRVSQEIAVWLVEALALIPKGMPKNAYSLVLDGHKCPEKATALFDNIVQRDAGIQAALEECYNRGLHKRRTAMDKRHHTCCIMKDFVDAMRLLGDENCSLLECNFDQGQPWDVAAVAAVAGQRKLWNWHEWATSRLEFPVTLRANYTKFADKETYTHLTSSGTSSRYRLRCLGPDIGRWSDEPWEALSYMFEDI